MKGTLWLILWAFSVNVVIGLSSRYPPPYGRAYRRRWYWKPLFIGKRENDQQVTAGPTAKCHEDKDCPESFCCLRNQENSLTEPTQARTQWEGTCELTPLPGDLCVLDTGSWAGHLCPCERGSICRPLTGEQEVGVCWKDQQ